MQRTEKTALITGGASGIGQATVRRLLDAGWRVLAVDLNAERGETLKRQLADSGHAAPSAFDFVVADVADERDISAAVEAAVSTFGSITCMVNNAGVGGAFGPITEIDVDDWDYTFAVIVRGVFLGTKHAARSMKALGRGGSIVNVASIAGTVGGMGPQAYSAAKAAVIHLSRLAAVELAECRIRVNSVSPGVIRTPLVATGRRDVDAALAGVQPWTQIGEPDDVARAIEFLAGDGARFITGEDLVVDGGLVAAGARLGDTIGGNPGLRGLVGVNRGTTGLGSTVRSKS